MLPILSTNLCHQPTNLQKTPAILYLKLLHKRPCGPMAQPDFSNRVSRLDEGDIKPKEKTFIDHALDIISTRNTKDLLCGTITGWIAGISIVKVGKVAAFGLGGGILLLHFACECGYISVNWERVRAGCARSREWGEGLARLVRSNSCYWAGLVGGFFFGIACS